MSRKKKPLKASSAEAQNVIQSAAARNSGTDTSQAVESTQSAQEQKKEISSADFFGVIFSSLSPNASEEQKRNRDDSFRTRLQQVISEHPVAVNYNLLMLYDQGKMIKSDADNIYNAVTAFTEKKPLLLVLFSTGGTVDSAYLIGKLCREYSNDKFVVVVPRQAKSAATLICCAANEIHMGSMSELGPIDPQIEGFPALGLKNSVEHLADLVKQYPAASEMFAKYLSYSLNPIHLGYYERVAESAKQYAERLLGTHGQDLVTKPDTIAQNLVYTYKDHGFVIDKTEATDIFGNKVIKTASEEYALGNAIYQMMNLVSRIADMMKNYFYFIGSMDSKPNFRRSSQ